jgi:hypothetical protein
MSRVLRLTHSKLRSLIRIYYFFDSYPFQPTIPTAPNISYDFMNYHSPFVFQDMSNYQHQPKFHG